MALGEPDAGKPPVRFDEGRSETVIGLCLSIRPLRLLYSFSKSVDVVLKAPIFGAGHSAQKKRFHVPLEKVLCDILSHNALVSFEQV